jgi:peroxiredoxin
MKRFLTVLIPFFFSFIVVSQNVTIKGTAPDYKNNEIGVWTNNDYISNTQKQLSHAVIDSAGNFLVEFNSKEILYITLKIEKHIASMYIQPDMNYEVKIASPDSTTYQNPNIEHDVKISINLKSKTEINSLTMDFDNRFDEFLAVDYKDFVRRTPQVKIDSFKIFIHDYYSTVKNSFFNTYVDYSIAALEKNTKMDEKKLFLNYIQNKPIQYNNKEYMNFFNSFYKQKLQTFALSKKGSDLFFIIDDRGSFPASLTALRRDVFITNDTIAELVILKGLYEAYYDGTFKKQGIIGILQQLATESKIEEHRKIAQNILNSFSKLQKGAIAPTFELPDKSGVTHNLDELRSKKYVYLMFYDEKCTSCIEQMKVISSLKKTYGERIEFVSISANKTNVELKNFQAKNPKYDWLFLYDDTNGKLKKEYEILSLPSYYLIGMDGKFISVPAESPEGNIEQLFYDLTKIKNKLHNIGSKENK